MARIEQETVARILDAADIVEVVSDFVTLKRRGANYIGLCPFHNERTPSFSVSKSRGICKCFSCGKGGSPVNFLMELEQMSYQEALRWLARKYNIEIKEREETDEDRAQSGEREALFALNGFARDFFVRTLNDTDEGRDVGLAYFRERGLEKAVIERFGLGYCPERGNRLMESALKAGYTLERLGQTGLCAHSDHGPYDRFRGRVIYPVMSLAGKVVAFGGRTLKSDKKIAKYVNSPESAIYSKSRELYGLYQARRAIVKEDRCMLVEGYMDVLSMSQSGVENVVASSGTSLTGEQVKLLHRFTSNVTVMYDSDAAGIKASLRGVDMLLADGMDVKVVLFPDGDDPDSYARSHSHEELARYIEANTRDFIAFKSEILLGDAGGDPVARSRAISDILRSIAVIPDPVTRQMYIEECARTFGVDDKLLSMQVAKGVAQIAEDAFVKSQRHQAEKTLEGVDGQSPAVVPATTGQPRDNNPLVPFERELMRYLVRYALIDLGETRDDEGNTRPVNVLGYVQYELESDGVELTDGPSRALMERIVAVCGEWGDLAPDGDGDESRMQFVARRLLSDPDDDVRRLANDMVSDRYVLSRYHTRYAHVESEFERLRELLPRAVYELKDAILQHEIAELQKQLGDGTGTEAAAAMKALMEKMAIRTEFARYLGERIITPRFKA